MVVKTFRGLLADGGQDRIRLSTIKGKVGYRIVKLQAMSENPYAGDPAEHIVKVYSQEQASVDGTVNFTDNDLLGVVIINNHTAGYSDPSIPVVIFDNKIFNQDIYVTHSDVNAALACNYYLELEVIPLDDKSAEYETIKDLRTRGF